MKPINYFKDCLNIIMATFTAFINPVIPFFILTGFLVTIDWLVAYRVNSILFGESFSSEKSKAVLIKFLIYGCCLIVARFVDFYILDLSDLGLTLKATMGYLILAELRSLDEKYYALKGIYIIKQITNFLNNLINKYKSNGEQ